MKKILCLVLAVAFCMVALTACGGGKSAKGISPTVTSRTQTKSGKLSYIVDGKNDTGWVANKKARSGNYITVEMDFGDNVSFNSITLNDTFDGGYTNEKDPYERAEVEFGDGIASTTESGYGQAGVISSNESDTGWKSTAEPEEGNPQWLWISLKNPVTVNKLTVDTRADDSYAKNYEIFYIAQTEGNTYGDATDYALLKADEDNTEKFFEIIPEENVVIQDIIVKIYEQELDLGEGEIVPTAAYIGKITFYTERTVFSHYPVNFLFQGKKDGGEYEVIVEERSNTEGVWKYTSKNTMVYRYVMYIVYEELEGNYPSLGEIIFE